MMHSSKRTVGVLVGLVCGLLLAAPSVLAANERIIASPVSPRDIATYALPADTVASQGLANVGIGDSIHLEAHASAAATVNSVVWEISVKPFGSNAILQEPVLGDAVPIYNVADRADFKVAGRKLLVPDVAGDYTITATITTDLYGAVIVSFAAAAGGFVGVGTVGDQTPLTPQCGVCHVLDDRVEPWQGTGHATFLERAMSGDVSSHYGPNCISCHTVGYNPTAGAANGGFDDVAATLGWQFPVDGDGHAVLDPSTWTNLPAELKTLSNIQCESCHGPGSEHSGYLAATDVSYDVGVCASCHDSGSKHVRPTEWKQSAHAEKPYRTTGSCAPCHTGSGFIAKFDPLGKPARTGVDHTIGCAACHDPHGASNEHQVRTTADVTLNNGEVVADGGLGKLCMQCHISRQNAEQYVLSNQSHFGPHYGPQTDMLLGANAVEYGKYISSSSGHVLAVENACSTCHMQTLAADNPAVAAGVHAAGSHTFKMAWDAGTPDDSSDDVAQTGVCATCHGAQTSFDLKTLKDFDGNGVAEGIQTEIANLMDRLALLLPPLASTTVAGPTADSTQAQRSGIYNYMFVRDDGSKGIHNPEYAAGILLASIDALQTASQPIGPLGGSAAANGWILSSWFGYYSNIFTGNWIFHQYHGPLYVDNDSDEFISLWDPVIGSWLLTSAELYPQMMLWNTQKWVTFETTAGGTRVFTDDLGVQTSYAGFSFDPADMNP